MRIEVIRQQMAATYITIDTINEKTTKLLSPFNQIEDIFCEWKPIEKQRKGDHTRNEWRNTNKGK